MIFQYSEILDYYWLSKMKQKVMAKLQQWFYHPCLASNMMKHTTMTHYDNGDDNGNEDGNEDNNSASRSGSDGLIFDLIHDALFLWITIAGMMATAINSLRTIYITFKDVL